MFAATRALALLLALSHTWAAVAKDDCEQIKAKRLTPDDLDTVSARGRILWPVKRWSSVNEG